MRRILYSGLAAAALAWTPPLRAEEPPPPAEREYRVDFRAGRVEVDTRLMRLELSDGVVIEVDRYRLLSDRLTLRRGPRGVEVEGKGRVAFCPCPDPPLSLTFDSATVAPPTDLLLDNPTVYAGGVPVFWLPVFWLRAKNRLGLLPPRLAWRGDDGLLAGAGVHVPLGADADSDLDVYGSGYLKGGAEVEARLSTEASSTRVRWDHLGESLLELDAHGSATGRHRGTAAWRLDAIRGARGRRGTIELEPASRRFDRGELELGANRGGVVLAAGAQSVARRSGPVDELGAVGPRAHVGLSEALGESGALDLSADVASFRQARDRSTTALGERGELSLSPVFAPLSASAVLSHGLELVTTELDSGLDAWAGLTGELSLPLYRAYGVGVDRLVHRVEPFVGAGARAGARRGERVPLPTLPSPNAPLLRVVGGVDSTLGRFASRGAARIRVHGGAVGPRDDLRPLLAGKLLADTHALAVSAVATWDAEQRREPTTLARARFGSVDSLHLSAHAEGRGAVEPLLARWLSAEEFSAPPLGWLDASGWTGGGELGVPWTRALATAVGSEHDLRSGRLLAVRGSIAYRHPCGCLAAVAWAGKRVGRGGADAWLSLDLMP